jgi:hypothetical protein
LAIERVVLQFWWINLISWAVCGLFKWRQFEPEVILLAVGWYLRFSLSYRDVEELLADRGLRADHVIIWRWVQSYAPEIVVGAGRCLSKARFLALLTRGWILGSGLLQRKAG